MNSPIIIQIIASFLDVETLLNFGKTCKLIRKISQADSHWEKLFILKYTSDLEFFGEKTTGKDYIKPLQSSSNYFSLFQEVYIKNKQWRRLIGSIFSECEIHLIASEVCESLKNPILPVPVLRRESRNYSTIIQDLLGNSLAEPVEAFYMPSPAENIMKGLFDCEEGLLREISEDRNRSYLIQSRWLIRKDKRPTTTSQALQRNKDIESMYLLHMLRVLKGTIRSHCKAVLAKLEKINELKTFLSEYCINWEAFSASISSIDPIFIPLSILINTAYLEIFPHKFRHPPFSIMRLMIVMWRRCVFSKVSEIIISGVLRILQSIRKEIKDKGIKEIEAAETSISLLMRTVQFVVDLSANELSLQFITHSQFEGDGSYSFLSQKVERITEQYYFDMLTLPLKTVRALLQADIVIVSRIFLTCTTEKINKMRVNTMMQCYQSHYFSLYKEYSIYFNDELATDPLMYTAFGKMLFSNDESNNSTKKIKNFIEQMKVKGNVKDILEYNDLDSVAEEYKKGFNYRDEEIEYLNRNAGFELEMTREEKTLFSIGSDLDWGLIKEFVHGQK